MRRARTSITCLCRLTRMMPVLERSCEWTGRTRRTEPGCGSGRSGWGWSVLPEGLSPFSDVPELPKPPDVRAGSLGNDSDCDPGTDCPASFPGMARRCDSPLGPQPVWGQQTRCPGSPIQGPGATSGTSPCIKDDLDGRIAPLPPYCVVPTACAGLGGGVTRSKGGRSIR